MPRWYAVFQHRGRPAETLESIAGCIRRERLGHAVPRITVEKRAQRNGEFYFALGIESEHQGHPPASLDQLLGISLLQRPIRTAEGVGYEPFKREQLASMMGSEQRVEDIARVLRYSLSGELSPDDPFAAPVRVDAPNDEDTWLERSQQYDYLLTWLSAMGSGSLTQLRSATVALGLSAPEDGTSRILRRLRLLGHIETSTDAKRWSVAPTALVASGDEPECFFLAGARDQALLTMLRNFGHVGQTPMLGGGAPSHVSFRPGDPRMVDYAAPLQKIAAGRAGERLAAVLPEIDEWVKTLQRVTGVRPEMYDLRHHDGQQVRSVALPRADGLYEFHEQRGISNLPAGDPKFSLYFDATRQEWFRGDWYGLRYLAEIRRRGTVTACYDAASQRLAVFRDQRWPELYERASVLASGQLPRIDGPWLIYDGVSPKLMDLLAERLHLDVDGAPRDA